MVRDGCKVFVLVVGLGSMVLPLGAVNAQCEIQQVYDSASLHVVGKTKEEQEEAIKDIKDRCNNVVKDSTCPVKEVIELAVGGKTKAQVVAECRME